LLVGLDRPGLVENFETAMAELELLADTAGAEIVADLVQKKAVPDPAYYIGPGKAQELADMVQHLGASLVIFMDELSPSQVRNLEQMVEAKIVDRTMLILDIFARRAHSREGKLQVELAQLQYLLPRLIGLGKQLSRLGGGIGTRGPGETQLEVDRRVIRKRIADLQGEIKDLRRHRALHRQRRKRSKQPVISLVGYTNAGKSTLLNTLTGAELYTEDKLFATLDPSVRSGILPGGKQVLYTDTVGFIQFLPKTLETAFRATLEEIAAADLLLHIVDLNHPDYENQVITVRDHLARIVPDFYLRELLVFNKTDLNDEGYNYSSLQRDYPGACFISAHTGSGLADLHQKIAAMLEGDHHQIRAYLPYSESALLNQIRQHGKILELDYQASCVAVAARVEAALAYKLLPFATHPEACSTDLTKNEGSRKR
jgi:GTPase